jgi:hypothetical protein
MTFVPIQLEEYVKLHLRSNPRENRADVTARLRSALADYKAGRRCHCGAPIWVIGSAGSRTYVLHVHHRRIGAI